MSELTDLHVGALHAAHGLVSILDSIAHAVHLADDGWTPERIERAASALRQLGVVLPLFGRDLQALL